MEAEPEEVVVSFDVVIFAKRVHLRLQIYEKLHGERPKITPALSRILELDPDYTPYRVRSGTKRRRPMKNPSISTAVKIAELLECSVGELVGEITITTNDVRMLYRVGQILDRTFNLGITKRE